LHASSVSKFRQSDAEAPAGHQGIESAAFQSDIDSLFSPILDIVKYYPDDEESRRTLLFAWVASIFKPISAVEVAEILGYDYRRISDLFTKLEKSSVFVANADSAYSRIAIGVLTVYLPRNLEIGDRINGRPPRLYVFRARLGIDLDRLIMRFNEDNEGVWRRVVSRISDFVVEMDPAYRVQLVSDYYFLFDRISKLLRALRDEGAISLSRGPTGQTIVAVRWRRGKSSYELPDSKPLNELF